MPLLASAQDDAASGLLRSLSCVFAPNSAFMRCLASSLMHADSAWVPWYQVRPRQLLHRSDLHPPLCMVLLVRPCLHLSITNMQHGCRWSPCVVLRADPSLCFRRTATPR